MRPYAIVYGTGCNVHEVVDGLIAAGWNIFVACMEEAVIEQNRFPCNVSVFIVGSHFVKSADLGGPELVSRIRKNGCNQQIVIITDDDGYWASMKEVGANQRLNDDDNLAGNVRKMAFDMVVQN